MEEYLQLRDEPKIPLPEKFAEELKSFILKSKQEYLESLYATRGNELEELQKFEVVALLDNCYENLELTAITTNKHGFATSFFDWTQLKKQ